jgi:hypothetical protein
VSRLSTHYLYRSSEGLNDGLELKVIEVEEVVDNGKTGDAKDKGSEMG